jgi:hypothetical protein
MRTMRTITLPVPLIFVATLVSAQAVGATVITLSCDGTVRQSRARDGEPKPVKDMGLIADLAEQTVSFSRYVAHIDNVTPANISFSGKTVTHFNGQEGTKLTVMGDIDRVTGAMTATADSVLWTDTYELLCKPVRPSF